MPDDRLRRLVEAGIALTSELSVEIVLRNLAEVAPGVVGARRAGFRRPESDASGSETLSVPILLRGALYGYLDLAPREGHAFASEERELAKLLAEQAAVAIENARRYESATRWLHQLEALTDIGNALASELELSRLLQVVAHRLRELIAARLVMIALPADGGEIDVSAADGESADGLIGTRLPRGDSKAGRVLARGRSERVDSLIDDVEAFQPLAKRLAARAALFVPMVIREQAIGVLIAVNKVGDDRFSDDDLRLAEAFAARAAIAVDLSERLSRGTAVRAVSAPAARPGGLTKRETEVLRLVTMGLSDAAVAERLVRRNCRCGALGPHLACRHDQHPVPGGAHNAADRIPPRAGRRPVSPAPAAPFPREGASGAEHAAIFCHRSDAQFAALSRQQQDALLDRGYPRR